jgi:hypothetical protein
MMSLASCGGRQIVCSIQSSIELLTLLLRAGILPVGAERVAESTASLALCTALELLTQRLASVQVGQQCLGILAPEDGAVLHARTRNTLDL